MKTDTQAKMQAQLNETSARCAELELEIAKLREEKFDRHRMAAENLGRNVMRMSADLVGRSGYAHQQLVFLDGTAFELMVCSNDIAETIHATIASSHDVQTITPDTPKSVN